MRITVGLSPWPDISAYDFLVPFKVYDCSTEAMNVESLSQDAEYTVEFENLGFDKTFTSNWAYLQAT